MIMILTTVLLVLGTICLAYLTTQVSLLGLPVAASWSDLSGAFTAAAALFTGLALVGVVATLRAQAESSKDQAQKLEDQGESLKTSLETQANAAASLKEAAKSLGENTATLDRRATLAERQMNLQIDERRLDRALKLLDSFFGSPRPDLQEIKDLVPTSEIPQARAKSLIPSEWLSSLGVLLSAVSLLKDDKKLPSYLSDEADSIIEEVRTRLSKEERSLLYLAMFPNRFFPDFTPSKLAHHLQRFELFPYIEDLKAPAVQGREAARRKIFFGNK